MSSVKEIELAITKLSESELIELRQWYDAYDSKHWDKQFESDAHNGRLDKLAEKAINDFQSGNYKEL